MSLKAYTVTSGNHSRLLQTSGAEDDLDLNTAQSILEKDRFLRVVHVVWSSSHRLEFPCPTGMVSKDV